MKTTIKFLIIVCLLAGATVGKAATPLDFDGDGKSDFALIRFRQDGNDFVFDWYIAQSSDNQVLHRQWGRNTPTTFDIYTAVDFDGDQKSDVAVYRGASDASESSVYYILNSADHTVRIEPFGGQFDDGKVVGDYDGDGRADLAVYRAGEPGYYIYRGSANNPNGNLTYVRWGSGFALTSHRGDYDGDGKLDFCLRIGNAGLYALLRSSDSEIEYIRWGVTGDIPAFADYDGDGRTDFAVRRTVNNQFYWYILERDGGGTGAAPILWGGPQFNDLPAAPGDYDGDGKADLGVYRSSLNATPNSFLIRRSSDGSLFGYQFGTANDFPIPIF